MTQSEIEQKIKVAGIDLQNNAKVIAEIMARQKSPSLRLNTYNYATGFEANYTSGFFPDGNHSNAKDHKTIKEAISYLLGINASAFTSQEAEAILECVVMCEPEQMERVVTI